MKKDELLSICRQQEALLNAARETLEEQTARIQELTEQLESCRLLEAENEQWRTRCSELEASLTGLEAQFSRETAHLNATWQTSCVTLAAEWNTKLAALSAQLQAQENEHAAEWSRLRTKLAELQSRGETELRSYVREYMQNWQAEQASEANPPVGDELENSVRDFVSGLINDLESALAG